MIDVHPPHEPIHGWRDFFLHLTTITIGLLIALSLEGLVEWQHHRHLVHEAEVNLRREIVKNTDSIHDAIDRLHKQQKWLKQDVVVLTYVIKNHKNPPQHDMELAFNFGSLDSVSWQTAQSTGALSYMPYLEAQWYSMIYQLQGNLLPVQQQSARDTTIAIGSVVNLDEDEVPTQVQAETLLHNIQTLQAQLLLEESYLDAVAASYKQFLAAHPN